MVNVYKFILDTGHINYVTAKSRTDAINKYHASTGLPKDLIKKHCLIVNEGKCPIDKRP